MCKVCPANTRSYDHPHVSCQCDKGFKCFNSNFRKMSVKQHGGLNFGTDQAKGNCPAFVLKIYAVGTS